MSGNNYSSQPGVVEGDGGSRRAVKLMQGYAVAPNGGATFDDDQRTTWNLWKCGQGFCRGDELSDTYGIDYLDQFYASDFRPNAPATSRLSLGSFER